MDRGQTNPAVPDPINDKYLPRTRDALYEVLRSSAALAYLSAKALDALPANSPLFNDPGLKQQVPEWFGKLNQDHQWLVSAQCAMGRDLRRLLTNETQLRVIDIIEHNSENFDLRRPESMIVPIERRTELTYMATTQYLPSSPYNHKASQYEKLTAIEQSVLQQPKIERRSPDSPFSIQLHQQPFIQNQNDQRQNNYEPASPNQRLETVQYRASPVPQSPVIRRDELEDSKHPFLKSPQYLERLKDHDPTFEQRNVPQQYQDRQTPSPSRRDDYGLSTSRYIEMQQSSAKNSISPLRITENSSIKRQEQVMMQGNRYSVIGDGSLSDRYYESPVEGKVQKLDESNAVVSKAISSMPSSYVRVIKEYKGEEYILTGKVIGPDGRESLAMRETVLRGSQSPGREISYRVVPSPRNPGLTPDMQQSQITYRIDDSSIYQLSDAKVSKQLFVDQAEVENKRKEAIDLLQKDLRDAEQRRAAENQKRLEDDRRALELAYLENKKKEGIGQRESQRNRENNKQIDDSRINHDIIRGEKGIFEVENNRKKNAE